jgi:hypothetical protein
VIGADDLRVTHPCASDPEGPLDLHVLSMPPAFVLSQDQTLHCVELDLNCYCVSDSSVVVVFVFTHSIDGVDTVYLPCYIYLCASRCQRTPEKNRAKPGGSTLVPSDVPAVREDKHTAVGRYHQMLFHRKFHFHSDRRGLALRRRIERPAPREFFRAVLRCDLEDAHIRPAQ